MRNLPSNNTPDESAEETDDEYPAFFERLEPDTQDYLVQYAREDETVPETLNRLILAAVPHSHQVKQLGIEPAAFDDDSRFVYERWPDTDGHVESRLYDDPMDYIRKHEVIVESTVGGRDE